MEKLREKFISYGMFVNRYCLNNERLDDFSWYISFQDIIFKNILRFEVWIYICNFVFFRKMKIQFLKETILFFNFKGN